jgi:subtilisin family serine protease
MRATPIALAVLLALSGSSLARSDLAPSTLKAKPRSVYIVEFEEPPLAAFRGEQPGGNPKLLGLKATSPSVTGARRLDVDAPASKAYRNALAELREDRLASASSRFGRALTPQFVYDVVNNGLAVELSADEAAQMATLPGVLRVEPDFVQQPMTDAGPQWVNADDLWNGVGAAGTRGEGVVVGIVDSGINRTHPSFAATGGVDGYLHLNPKGRLFGRCATPEQAAECTTKLIGIHDFTTGDSDDEANDGLDGTGHGSHVAATAVGNVLNFTLPLSGGAAQRRLSGVAPHANVISYKACEEEARCVGSWLVAAINQAVSDGVDVINYSIGGGATSPWSRSDAVGMLNAREAGVVVVVAAGNEGPGSESVTGPGNAPWVITAANATHDRAIVNRLVDLTGGAGAPPSGGILVGASQTGAYGPRALVIDPQFPGCSQGNDLDSPPNGASNPWPAGRFNGEIVVCERGVQARVAKSNNVRLAGGGGMVLINTAADGAGTVADAHSIPSTHLGFAQGQALKSWMATGSGHQARIEGQRVELVPDFADVLSGSSGRGPVPSSGVLKPDLTAPGSNILAANGTGTGAQFLSGTSMATPHITGAVALLAALKPGWTPSQIESALLTSARNVVKMQDGATPATPLDQGAGAMDVARATQAGLAFNLARSDFLAANPASGGSPRTLNRPSLLHDECFERCTLTRRISDLAGGASWRVETDIESPGAVTVTPSTFSLAAGQTIDLSIEVDVSDASFPGSWVHGRVRFVRTAGAAAANAEIPLSVYADPGPLPTRIELSGPAESGFQDVLFTDLVALPKASFSATALVAPEVTERVLGQDPTRDDRYDGFTTGLFFTLVRVPAASGAARQFKLSADTRSPTSTDVDLFVGQDFDGDGQPDEDEQLCESTSEDASEHCELDVPQGASEVVYWVLAQNWDAGVSGTSDPAATDSVVLETALVDLAASNNAGLVATGPGHTESQEGFRVRFAWNDPTLLPGERRIGYVRLGASVEQPGQVGLVPVEVKRAALAQAQDGAQILSVGGARRMRLAPGRAQEKLYFDVPPNASGLSVSVGGTGEVDLYLARAASPGSPAIDAAPARGQAAASGTTPGASESLNLSGAALTAGRWYATPVNTGSSAALIDLGVALTFGSERPTPRFGAYYNPQRSGAGVYLLPSAEAWSVTWYTYLQDGTPTWYLGVGPAPTANAGVWRVPLERISWDGLKATGTRVGEVQIALRDAQNFTFSWNMDGESGSENMTFIDGGACPELNGAPAALTGLWYSPAKSGFGYSVNAYPGLESNAAYFYDGLGVARWALGQVAPFGVTTMTLSQRDGFCPLCTHKTPTASNIGVLTRRYDTAQTGQMSVDLELLPPMKGGWTVDLPVSRISNALLCP